MFDMSADTGEIHRTLSQTLPVCCSVIVTTPQES